ncbi:MAG: histidine kinase, partial [Lachnospiraceae bacterium]|nr:histidine kinase [Lachnospiraceae bacterium]
SMMLQDFREDDWYQKVKASETPLWTCQSTGSFLIRDIDNYMISIMVPVIDRASYRFLGMTVVDVRMDDLKQISQNGMVFDGMLMLLDENNKVLYSDYEGKIEEEQMERLKTILSQEKLEESTTEISMDDSGFLISSMPLDIAGWKIVGMVSQDMIYSESNAVRNLMLVVSAVCIFLSVMLSAWVSKGISSPILFIRSVMKKVERGDLKAHAQIRQKDEIGELAESFNHMVDKLNMLVEQQKQSQEKLRMAELNALQAQINPHFLYNTLDSINWMARAGQVDQVSEMINSLSIFFRISLSRGKTFITVGEELTHVENYILIQKKRYERYLDYEISVPGELYGYQCLKMILQPLVENSIYHGIKEKGERGMIKITAEERNGTLLFHVADTGQGMTPEKLSELQQMMQEGREYNTSAYGVINVQRRIQTYFGRGYGLHFQSAWGQGTEVSVAIPKRMVQEELNELEDSNRGR